MGKSIYRNGIMLLALGWPGAIFAAGAKPDQGVLIGSPELAVSGPAAAAEDWTRGFGAIYDELMGNLLMPDKFFATRHVQPGPAWPDDVYLWDTAFIAEVWRLWDVKTAQEITRAVLDHADQGRLQHAVGPDEHYQTTQPPVLEWALWRIYQQSGDREFLAYAYPILRDYNRWLYRNRRLPNGLFFWKHPYESGMDNSPRFANRSVTHIADMRNLAAVDFSAYMVVHNASLARMADALGFAEDARRFQAQSEELKQRINQLLWDEASGLYYDRDLKHDRLLKVKTIASVIPLFAGIPDADRAKRLRDHIMDPAEYNTPVPLPSVARDDPAFEKNMWRGPVWINTAYLVILGLEQYGYRPEAAELTYRLVDAVYRQYLLSGNFYEFYDPDHEGLDELGRKDNFLELLALRPTQPKPHFVGWDGLVNNLVIEHLLGWKRQGKSWQLCPSLPTAAEEASFQLALPADALILELIAEPGGGFSGRMRGSGKETPFALGPGACLEP